MHRSPPELAPKPGEDCCAKAAKPPAPPKPLLKAAALEAAGVAGCPKPAPKLLGWPNPGVAACMNAGCAKLVEVAAGCPKPVFQEVYVSAAGAESCVICQPLHMYLRRSYFIRANENKQLGKLGINPEGMQPTQNATAEQAQ